MYRTLTILAAAAVAAPLTAHAQARDQIVNVAPGDPQMNAAIARAKAGLPVFFGHVSAPGPGETSFLVKYDVIPESGVEFVWAEIISHRGGQTVARLVNEPVDKRFKFGQQVTLNDDQVIDWSYRKAGVTVGSHTTRVLLSRMPEAEAAPIRKYLGW
jgi:uncharacterized protein YegJ (DUF2314 family)